MATPSTQVERHAQTGAPVVQRRPATSVPAARQVWHALEKASFAVLSFVGPDGEPRSSGVVYAIVERRMVVVTAPDSLKSRRIHDDQVISVTVPIRRGGLLSLLVPIPPASITFCARATVHPTGSIEIATLAPRLSRLLPEQRRSGTVLELAPVGSFLAYGIGMSLRDMRDPSRALARVPMDEPDQGVVSLAARESVGRLSRREHAGLLVHRSLDRWLNTLGVWVYRRTKGGVAKPWKVDVLLLTTRGRRTGRDRTVVLQYFSDGEAMVVTAANDGGQAYPAWYHNLVADPEARMEVGGRTIPVTAVHVPDEEAASWWARIVERDPSYARFRRATQRPFPILRLDPHAAT